MTVGNIVRIEVLERLLEGPVHCYGLSKSFKKKFDQPPTYEFLRDWLSSLEKSEIIKSERKIVNNRPRKEYTSIPGVTAEYLEDLKKGKARNELQIIVMLPDR